MGDPLANIKEFSIRISMMKMNFTAIFTITTSRATLGLFDFVKLCSFTITPYLVVYDDAYFTLGHFPVPGARAVVKAIQWLYFITHAAL